MLLVAGGACAHEGGVLDGLGQAPGGVRDEFSTHQTQAEQPDAAHHTSTMPVPHGEP